MPFSAKSKKNLSRIERASLCNRVHTKPRSSSRLFLAESEYAIHAKQQFELLLKFFSSSELFPSLLHRRSSHSRSLRPCRTRRPTTTSRASRANVNERHGESESSRRRKEEKKIYTSDDDNSLAALANDVSTVVCCLRCVYG